MFARARVPGVTSRSALRKALDIARDARVKVFSVSVDRISRSPRAVVYGVLLARRRPGAERERERAETAERERARIDRAGQGDERERERIRIEVVVEDVDGVSLERLLVRQRVRVRRRVSVRDGEEVNSRR